MGAGEAAALRSPRRPDRPSEDDGRAPVRLGLLRRGERRLSLQRGLRSGWGWRVGAGGKGEDAFPEEMIIGKGAGARAQQVKAG